MTESVIYKNAANRVSSSVSRRWSTYECFPWDDLEIDESALGKVSSVPLMRHHPIMSEGSPLSSPLGTAKYSGYNREIIDRGWINTSKKHLVWGYQFYSLFAWKWRHGVIQTLCKTSFSYFYLQMFNQISFYCALYLKLASEILLSISFAWKSHLLTMTKIVQFSPSLCHATLRSVWERSVVWQREGEREGGSERELLWKTYAGNIMRKVDHYCFKNDAKLDI